MRPFMHLVYLLAVPRLFSTTNAIPAPVTPANFEGPLPQRVPQPEPARVVRGRAAAATTPVGIPDCPPPGFSCEKNCDCTGKTGSE